VGDARNFPDNLLYFARKLLCHNKTSYFYFAAHYTTVPPILRF